MGKIDMLEKYDMFDLSLNELEDYYLTGMRFLSGTFGVSRSDINDYVDVIESGNTEDVEEDELLSRSEKLSQYLSSLGCASNRLSSAIEMAMQGTDTTNENHHHDHEASIFLIQTGVLIALGMMITEGHLIPEVQDE